jgi:cell division protein FtsN
MGRRRSAPPTTLCDKNFPRPLADVRVAAQAAPAAKPAPSPAPTPAQPRPAPASPAAAPPSPRPTVQPSARSGSTVSAGVQVGGTPDPSEARAIQTKVRAKFSSQLQGLKIDVVTATADQKTIYRVVITGFQATSEANRLCTTLKAGGQACFVRN